MEELTLDFADLKRIVPFLHAVFKQGGLFVRTSRHYKMGQSLALQVTLPDALEAIPVSGKVAWLTPQGAQNTSPAGIGVAFIDDKLNLRDKIEKLLSGTQESAELTFTL